MKSKGNLPNWFCRTFALWLAIGAVALSSSGCTKSNSTSTEGLAAGGKMLRPAPDFELSDSAGKKFKLSDFKGTPVILHFWASWCPPCVDELPQFLETAKEYEGKKIKFFAVSLDKTWADAHKILPQAKLPDSVVSVIDPDEKTPDQLGSYQFPESYLLDSDHHIVEKWVGGQDWKAGPVRAAMDRVLAH